MLSKPATKAPLHPSSVRVELWMIWSPSCEGQGTRSDTGANYYSLGGQRRLLGRGTIWVLMKRAGSCSGRKSIPSASYNKDQAPSPTASLTRTWLGVSQRSRVHVRLKFLNIQLHMTSKFREKGNSKAMVLKVLLSHESLWEYKKYCRNSPKKHTHSRTHTQKPHTRNGNTPIQTHRHQKFMNRLQ